MKDKILPYVLQNMIKYQGSANPKAVLGPALKNNPELKTQVPDVLKTIQEIIQEHPAAELEVMLLELNSLASVRTFVKLFSEKYQQLHFLIENEEGDNNLKFDFNFSLQRSDDDFEIMNRLSKFENEITSDDKLSYHLCIFDNSFGSIKIKYEEGIIYFITESSQARNNVPWGNTFLKFPLKKHSIMAEKKELEKFKKLIKKNNYD